MIALVVHTTGVNWDGVLANLASITVVLVVIGGFVARNIKTTIKDEILGVIDAKVTPILDKIQGQLSDHDTRLARIEGIEEGKRQAIAQAGVSTKETR